MGPQEAEDTLLDYDEEEEVADKAGVAGAGDDKEGKRYVGAFVA